MLSLARGILPRRWAMRGGVGLPIYGRRLADKLATSPASSQCIAAALDKWRLKACGLCDVPAHWALQSDSVDVPNAVPPRPRDIGPLLALAVRQYSTTQGTSRGTDSAELSSFRMSMQWYCLAISTKTHVDPILAPPPYITPSERHS